MQRPEDAKRAYGRALALKPDFAPARDKLAALTGTVAVAATTRSDAAAEPAFRPIVSGNHPIVTGAIEGPDLVVRKVEQPQAVAPSQELLAASDLQLPPAVEETPVEPEIPAPAPAQRLRCRHRWQSRHRWQRSSRRTGAGQARRRGIGDTGSQGSVRMGGAALLAA